jgi:hypothetical protein
MVYMLKYSDKSIAHRFNLSCTQAIEYTIPLVCHGGTIVTVAAGLGTRVSSAREEMNAEVENLVYYVGPYTHSGTEAAGVDCSQLLIIVHDRLGGLYFVDLMKGGEKVKLLSKHRP